MSAHEHNLDREIHALGEKFDVAILEEASYILWYIWRNTHAKYATLNSCIDALFKNAELHQALKDAHNERNYSVIRNWVSASSASIDAETEANVIEFLDELRPAMTRLVQGNVSLPFWEPSPGSMSSDIAAHLKGLRIPYLKGKPNVLLHDLGSFKEDPILKRRLNNIFMPNNHTFLVNTSGSGKTRLLLEGLCDNWGFYFTSMVDSSLLGSSDVQNGIQSYIPDSPNFYSSLPAANSPDYDSALKSNRRIAGRIFSLIFLARLLIFDLFASIMNQKEVDIMHQGAYKERWLLLQLQPSLLHSRTWDIFDDLVGKLSKATDPYINAKTKTLLARVRKFCTGDPANSAKGPDAEAAAAAESEPSIPLFCVLDEAQYAATEHSSAFRSDQNGARRPVLREIVRAWEGQSVGQGVFMVVAGTGISKDVVDQAMASAIMKDSKYRWCSDTGAFDHVDIQRQYILKYLPSSIVNSNSGKRLLERIWYWLHGRYRFTAGFVAELLGNGFQRPHGLLNAYIEHFTHFNPSDAQIFVEAEGPDPASISSRYRLDFFKLAKNSDMITTIHQITTHYLMRTVLPGTLGKDEATYVEYGFARFVDSETKTVAVDEPLVLLAATHWINANYRSTYKYFAKQIHLHDPTSNGFENYVAFCLHLIFAQKRRLTEVFSFSGAVPTWADQEAELIALHRTEQGDIEEGRVRDSESSRPSVTIGTNAKTTEETHAWLDHRLHTPLCFPHISMGPDILFVLKLSDGTSIWVALQAKYSLGKNGSLSRPLLRHAMRSVTPSQFYKNKDGNCYSPTTHPDLTGDTSGRLSMLPHRRSDAGKYSLLRAIVSFPAETNLKRCLEEDPDVDGHPIACLNMNLVKQLTRDFSPVGFLEGLEPCQGSKKRKAAADNPRKRTKKLKLN